jgi:hypothetical protein
MKLDKYAKSKMLKETIISLMFFILVFSVVNIVAADEPWPAVNVCCEKTLSGAWCQNVPDGNCDSSFRKTPTSCDATSYCKLGCCVDSEEGLCMENTPQKVCEVSAGTWLDDEKCEVPQCELGCCIIGDQASFVTLTRCKRLSNIYGLQTNYRTDISNEASCIMTAYSTEKGACVYEEEFVRTCKTTTRGECQDVDVGNGSGSGEFFKDYLCSADELATDCGPTTDTTCVEGKHEVYFKDSCGNPANIYDAEKIYSSNPGYWQTMFSKSDSCGYGNNNGNAGSRTCGNCDYLSGSICKKGEASYGDLICKDLNCYDTSNGNDYKNGESWCIYQSPIGDGEDTVGSRHYRHICMHGEEIIEPCADFRNEVCFQDRFDTAHGNFNEAACRPNRWADCIDQTEQDDCENTDKRDCYWVKGVHYDGSNSKTSKDQNADANLADEDPEKENFGILQGEGICLPGYPPGLEFWQESNADSICGLANSRQTVHFTEDFFGNKECDENCDVLEGKWVQNMNKVCTSLGDCGNFENLVGMYTDDGIVVKDNGKKRKISQGISSAGAVEEGEGFFGDLF